MNDEFLQYLNLKRAKLIEKGREYHPIHHIELRQAIDNLVEAFDQLLAQYTKDEDPECECWYEGLSDGSFMLIGKCKNCLENARNNEGVLP